MKHIKNPLIYVLAVVGLCALLYGAWALYQQQAAEEYHRWFFSAPASSGIPDVLHATPGPLPPP